MPGLDTLETAKPQSITSPSQAVTRLTGSPATAMAGPTKPVVPAWTQPQGNPRPPQLGGENAPSPGMLSHGLTRQPLSFAARYAANPRTSPAVPTPIPPPPATAAMSPPECKFPQGGMNEWMAQKTTPLGKPLPTYTGPTIVHDPSAYPKPAPVAPPRTPPSP